MDQNNQTPSNVAPEVTQPVVDNTTTPAPAPVAAVSSPVGSGATPPTPKKSGLGKKGMVIALLILVLIALAAIGGYFYYANVMNKPSDQMSKIIPTIAPMVTNMPTEAPDAIKDSSELDNVVKELDTASDEADITNEAKNLQTDSNF